MKQRGAAPESTNEPSAIDALRARVVKKHAAEPSAQKQLAEAGTYEVTHGRICLGHDAASGESVFAHGPKGEGKDFVPGEHVELTAEEATRMLAEKCVKKVA